MALITPAYCTDQQYPFSTLRLQMASIVSAGVINLTDLQVSASSGLQVQIASGQAYVQQTVTTEGAVYKGLYYEMNDAPASPYNTVSAPISNPRVDMVVLRVYDVIEQSLSGSSFARFEWVEGTETAGATLANLDGIATLPDNSLNLAYVLQTVGEGSISPSNILNLAQPALSFGAAAGDLKISAASSYPGYVPCDGAAYSRNGYQRLFSAIGTTWGTGDGSTTFNVPDLRGRTVIGAGSGSGGLTPRSVGQTGGEETHLLSENEMPPHAHGPGSSQLGFVTETPSAAAFSIPPVTQGNTGVQVHGTTDSQGGGSDHNNMQPFGVANYLIRL